jgi:hypothetical protein
MKDAGEFGAMTNIGHFFTAAIGMCLAEQSDISLLSQG